MQIQVVIYSGQGVAENTQVHASESFVRIEYARARNRGGAVDVWFHADDAATQFFSRYGYVRILRKDQDLGIDDYILDFDGWLAASSWETDSNGVTLWHGILMHLDNMLERAVVMYKDGVVNRSFFTSRSARYIADSIVRYNLTSAGTTNDGRLYAARGLITSVAPVDDGAVQSDDYSGRVVYDCVRELALAVGADWRVYRSGDSDLTPRFGWTPSASRPDKSASVVFGYQRGNVRSSRYQQFGIEEYNLAMVRGGRDVDNVNLYGVTPATSFAQSYQWETFVSAIDNAGDLNNVAAARAKMATRAGLAAEADIVQTRGQRLNVEYAIGDIVSIETPAESGQPIALVVIEGYSVSARADGSHEILVTVEAVP